MTEKERQQIITEQYFKFVRIPKSKQNWLLHILEYCKEVRNTMFPLEDSEVTELSVVEFTAHKDKNIYVVNGSLALSDGGKFEGRSFSAYIDPISEGETRIYLDVTREGSENVVVTMFDKYQKKISTNETIIDIGDKMLVITSYNGMGMTFQDEISKKYVDEVVDDKRKQLSAF